MCNPKINSHQIWSSGIRSLFVACLVKTIVACCDSISAPRWAAIVLVQTKWAYIVSELVVQLLTFWSFDCSFTPHSKSPSLIC